MRVRNWLIFFNVLYINTSACVKLASVFVELASVYVKLVLDCAEYISLFAVFVFTCVK